MSDKPKIPRHVAIIMDGNGRWATQQGLPRTAGHKAGAEVVTDVLDCAISHGVEFLTLYAFSTENWKRPISEVTALMGLLEKFIDDRLVELQERNVRLMTVGRTAGLPRGARKKLLNAIEETKTNSRGTLVLALNYGGRAEIADAAAKIAEDVAAGKIKPSKVDEKLFAKYLYEPEIPDVDLMIRTSGELRLSNFLLWELAYAEICVTDKLWPDFGEDDFVQALATYGNRDRRFGGVKDAKI